MVKISSDSVDLLLYFHKSQHIPITWSKNVKEILWTVDLSSSTDNKGFGFYVFFFFLCGLCFQIQHRVPGTLMLILIQNHVYWKGLDYHYVAQRKMNGILSILSVCLRSLNHSLWPGSWSILFFFFLVLFKSHKTSKNYWEKQNFSWFYLT